MHHFLIKDPETGIFQITSLICYESIFPELPRNAVREGADIMVNITNDGWFGMSAGPVQHAWMARLRAAEYGIPLVRCANNGISFITDARGTILTSLELGRRGFIIEDITLGHGRTIFTVTGNRPLIFILLLWTIVGLWIGGRFRNV